MEARTKIIISALGLVTGMGAWMAWSFHQPTVSAEPFDPATWVASSELADGLGDPGCVRGGMALDLIDRERLMGMTAEEVSALLRTPMRCGPEWAYALGQCSGYGWHDSRLVVRFSLANRVTAAWFQHVP